MRAENLSFWLAEALGSRELQTETLDGDATADICIVGGGFTGLWTAIELKRRDPSLRVAIVERQFCGSGASGRNGGFALSLWAKFLTLKKLCGTEEAVRLCKASADCVRAIDEFCDANAIDADFRACGWLWAATSKAQIGTWTATVEAIEAAGCAPFRHCDSQEVALISGSPQHLAGVFEAGAACVQPAKLALGLRGAAIALGVRIFENSPMMTLESGARPVVRCARGSVAADTVVIAMNAWGAMLPEIRRAIAVVSSDIVVTDPMPDRLDRCGWRNGPGIIDARMLVHYYRTTPDGRIVFGKGGGGGVQAYGGRLGGAFDGPSRISGEVQRWLDWTYPNLRPHVVAQSWTGPIDRSGSGLPMFGRLEGSPRVLYGVGYSGNGVAPSLLGGRILASLALDARDEWSECGLVRPLDRAFPPEPFRYFGGKLVRSAIRRVDDANDAGRAPGAVTRALASLAPKGLSPTKSASSDGKDA